MAQTIEDGATGAEGTNEGTFDIAALTAELEREAARLGTPFDAESGDAADERDETERPGGDASGAADPGESAGDSDPLSQLDPTQYQYARRAGYTDADITEMIEDVGLERTKRFIGGSLKRGIDFLSAEGSKAGQQKKPDKETPKDEPADLGVPSLESLIAEQEELGYSAATAKKRAERERANLLKIAQSEQAAAQKMTEQERAAKDARFYAVAEAAFEKLPHAEKVYGKGAEAIKPGSKTLQNRQHTALLARMLMRGAEAEGGTLTEAQAFDIAHRSVAFELSSGLAQDQIRDKLRPRSASRTAPPSRSGPPTKRTVHEEATSAVQEYLDRTGRS